jgi:hypothetical protein
MYWVLQVLRSLSGQSVSVTGLRGHRSDWADIAITRWCRQTSRPRLTRLCAWQTRGGGCSRRWQAWERSVGPPLRRLTQATCPPIGRGMSWMAWLGEARA